MQCAWPRTSQSASCLVNMSAAVKIVHLCSSDVQFAEAQLLIPLKSIFDNLPD